MTFPVRTMVRSSLLNGQSNGKLDTRILDMTPGQVGGATVVLVKPAARAWRALAAAAKQAGHILKATSVSDSYRIYEIQERIFRERYTLTYLAGRPYKMWNGRRWYQRPGTAVAAVPGTSNHGWASAVDCGEERDSDAAAESLDTPTLSWLLANEQTYGWSHEVQSEPWHLRYFAGDRIPPAVISYERSLNTPPEDDDVKHIVWFKKGTDNHAYMLYDRSGIACHLTQTGLDLARFLGVDEVKDKLGPEWQDGVAIMDGPCRNVPS